MVQRKRRRARALAVSLASAGLVATLLATPASARPGAGNINITVNPIEVAYAYDVLVGPLLALTTSAFWTPDTPDLSVSEDDAYAFQDALVRKGLPAQLTAVLAKLGFTSGDQKELRAQIMAVDPSLLVGSPLADAKLLASLRAVAADLRAFSKKAARDPLHTGQ